MYVERMLMHMESISLFELMGIEIPEEQPAFVNDRDCSIHTPVILGKPDEPIYGRGKRIHARVPSRTDSEHMRSIGLNELLPLEDYDKVIVLFSGGKDSMACYYKLLELGVPKEKIELWHHDIDGQNAYRRMDWPVTKAYVEAFAKAEDVPLRVSWRQNGFFGELYRIGASEPVYWQEPDLHTVHQCKLTKEQQECLAIKEKSLPDMEETLKEYGYRHKFPAKTGDLTSRWCSAYLKIMVMSSITSNILSSAEKLEFVGGKRMKFPSKGSPQSGRWCSGNLKAEVERAVITKSSEYEDNVKLLFVSGERRGESKSRSRYNEMEIHRTNAEKKKKRTAHLWRAVIDYSEKDVWEVLKRHRVVPHPCYYAGWPRCSCAACIFSTPRLWAGYRELFPEEFEALCRDEETLNFTIDNNKNLRDFVGDTKSCVCHDRPEALRQLVTGEYTVDDVYFPDEADWVYPAGAFHGAEGGPC